MKNLKSNFNYLYWLSAFFLWMGCQKSEFVNLTSSISSDNNIIGVTEGDALIVNVNLTDELTEDLTLELKINRDLESGTYIDLDDFQNYFSYSADAGETWIRGTKNEVILPKRTNILKIRLETIDDQKMEVHEKFTLEIFPKSGNVFKLKGQIAPKEITVYDNEPIPNVIFQNEALFFSLDQNNQYQLHSINREAHFNKVMREILDNGPEQLLLNDINTLVQAGGIPVNHLAFVFDDSAGWSGYVNNRGQNEDDWVMGLNLMSAYTKFDEKTNSLIYTDYDEEGQFAYVLVHEYGHIMTLNVKDEQKHSVFPEVEQKIECENLSLFDGCFYENSILNQFNNLFYLSDIKYNKPNYVTQYASTNISEDIAETFAFFIGQETINPVNKESSGALRKINYVANQERLKVLKNPIINGLSRGKILIRDEEMIRKFNRTPQGKQISCTDYETIHQMTEKANQKRNQ